MALNAYLKLTGETQGLIKGSVKLRGRTNSIMVIATQHDIVSPFDAASGLPTGKRQHHPFVISKEVDKSTPLLYKALTNNENIVSWELKYWQPSKTGQEQQHFSIKLTNARIVGIRNEMLNNKFPENMPIKEMEHVSFVYQTITWTAIRNRTTSEDDWEAPNA